jgi:two-component system response regulator AdeR
MAAVDPPILVVEDDATTADVVRAYLERDGYQTVVCSSGGRALDLVRQLGPRCIVLDVMLPERNGFEITEALRERGSTVPLLILSARAEEADRIRGLRLGADDYLVKPFSPGELVARVAALLRRAEAEPSPTRRLRLGALRLDTDRREAMVGDRVVVLTFFEFCLIEALLEQPGRVFTRGQLLGRVYQDADVDVLERTIDVHVARIRDKLKAAAADATIVTVRGVGYKADVPVARG